MSRTSTTPPPLHWYEPQESGSTDGTEPGCAECGQPYDSKSHRPREVTR